MKGILNELLIPFIVFGLAVSVGLLLLMILFAAQ